MMAMIIVSSISFVSAYINSHHSHILSLSPSASLNRNKVSFVSFYARKDSIRYPRRKSSHQPSSLLERASNESFSESPLSASDLQHMKQAICLARMGYGNTFPNPAVGCLIVRHHNGVASLDEVIGSGFHPMAGMPHAEVFALFEACGHVKNGVEAARSVMGVVNDSNNLSKQVLHLLSIYKSQGGASTLFKDHFRGSNVTAYVTLEPCCHVGKTPPCALSLVTAGIKRVVVGFRDNNPVVNGGGMALLKDAGVDVCIMSHSTCFVNNEQTEVANKCSELVKYFVKRMSSSDIFSQSLNDVMNGKKRRALRSLAWRRKTEGSLPILEWVEDTATIEEKEKPIEDVNQIYINHRLLDTVDNSLWENELVQLRLNNIVNKKKDAKILGERIANIVKAQVAQTIGHTVLLYRPDKPPIIDLDELLRKESEADQS